MATDSLVCDGCGQPATPEHIARRLQRLEWTTRWRPIHIATLLLGAFSPEADADFLYGGKFDGEASRVLESVGISVAGRPAETVLTEFQRGGFFLTHVLECPLEQGLADVERLLAARMDLAIARIRRSLKPKRVVLVSEFLTPIAGKLTTAELGSSVLLDNGKPFALDTLSSPDAVLRLREILETTSAAR